LNTDSGEIVASLGCGGDVDDIFYNSADKLIYLSCGQGEVDVFQETDPDRDKMVNQIPTAAGARTSLLAPELNALFVAVPRRAHRDAEIELLRLR